MKTYSEAVRFLDHHVNYEKGMEQIVYNERNLDLGRFERFLEEWGAPHSSLDFIHIAGTKGKGSTAAMLEASLVSAGFRVGLYVSPHLETYLERFRIDGKKIPEDRFVSYLDKLSGRFKNKPETGLENFKTVFEILTATAFLYFRDEKVDVAIMETGLGGRLDATNVIDPRLCVITALGMDHTRLLGDTISDIAREKGGIIKDRIPVILAPQQEDAKRLAIPVLREICEKRNAPLIEASSRVEILQSEIIRGDSEPGGILGQKIRFRVEKKEYEITLPLLGTHQVENFQTMIAALIEMNGLGFRIEPEKAFPGVIRTHWQGRFEILPGTPYAVLDGAHCPLSAKALVRTLGQCFSGLTRVFVLGMLEGKDVLGICRELSKDTDCGNVITFPSPSPRGYGAEELASLIRGVFPSVEIAESPEKAVDLSLKYADQKSVIVVTGSLYNLDRMKKLFAKIRQ